MSTTLDLTARLELLRDDYTYRVNMLLEEGREDLAARLVDDYLDDATSLMRAGLDLDGQQNS